MPRYRYEANNEAGEALKGVLTATSATAATTTLEARGLNVRSVSLDARQLGAAEAPMAAAVDRLMESRDTLAEPLAAYAEEIATGRRRQELLSIAKLLREGDREAALTAAGNSPSAWSALLAAAAEGDHAAGLFRRFLDREITATVVRRRRSLALTYPLVFSILCLAVVWAMSVIIMPTFSDIFRDFGLELPAVTLFALTVGCFLAGGGAIFLLGLLLSAVVLWSIYPWWAPPRLRRFIKKISGLRRVNRSLSNAKLSAQLANLLEAGLPISASVMLADSDADISDAPTGRSLPAGAITYAAAGDFRTETRARLLRVFTVNSNEAVAGYEPWTPGMAGPLSVAALGFLVAFTMIALFMPLVKLIEGLS